MSSLTTPCKKVYSHTLEPKVGLSNHAKTPPAISQVLNQKFVGCQPQLRLFVGDYAQWAGPALIHASWMYKFDALRASRSINGHVLSTCARCEKDHHLLYPSTMVLSSCYCDKCGWYRARDLMMSPRASIYMFGKGPRVLPYAHNRLLWQKPYFTK